MVDIVQKALNLWWSPGYKSTSLKTEPCGIRLYGRDGEGSQQRRVASRAVPHGGTLGGEDMAGQWERNTQLLTLGSATWPPQSSWSLNRVQTPGQVSLRRGRVQGIQVGASGNSQEREPRDLNSEQSPWEGLIASGFPSGQHKDQAYQHRAGGLRKAHICLMFAVEKPLLCAVSYPSPHEGD